MHNQMKLFIIGGKALGHQGHAPPLEEILPHNSSTFKQLGVVTSLVPRLLHRKMGKGLGTRLCSDVCDSFAADNHWKL